MKSVENSKQAFTAIFEEKIDKDSFYILQLRFEVASTYFRIGLAPYDA
jgi:hypothetical protein